MNYGRPWAAVRSCACAEKDGQITAQQFKDRCGTTRKFTIPLAEQFDPEKLTLRVGDARKLRGR